MTLDQIDRVVRQANPVPDLSALEPFDASVLDQQRRTEMQTHDRVIVDDEGDEPKRGRNLLIGIAAAAAIIIGALLLLPPLTSDAPVADQPSTTSAVETATAFVEAYASHNIDEAFGHVADGADGFGSLAEERLMARFLEAIGDKAIFTDPCEQVSTLSDGVVVSCPNEWHQLRSDELGLGPWGDHAYNITVREGKVVGLETIGSMNFSDPNGFSKQMWEPFAAWVARTHPDDVAIMYEDVSQTGWRVTEESIPVWEQRTREYVAAAPSLEAVGEAEALAAVFVGAYGAFNVDQAASYLASDADLWLSDLEQVRLENRLLEAQGFKLLLDFCRHRNTTPDGIVVGCSWDFHAIRSEERGLGPFSGSWFDLTVRDGKIVAATMNWGISKFSPQVWEPFAAWVAENYPEDVDVMYVDFSNYRLTEESIALWEQRSREYADFVGG